MSIGRDLCRCAFPAVMGIWRPMAHARFDFCSHSSPSRVAGIWRPMAHAHPELCCQRRRVDSANHRRCRVGSRWNVWRISCRAALKDGVFCADVCSSRRGDLAPDGAHAFRLLFPFVAEPICRDLAPDGAKAFGISLSGVAALIRPSVAVASLDLE